MRLAAAAALLVATLAPPALAAQGASLKRVRRPVAPSVAAARDAQRDFERRRVSRLPTTFGGGSGGPCEVQIGRLCYWNNNGDLVPPREPVTIAAARDALLDRLTAAARDDSTDDW